MLVDILNKILLILLIMTSLNVIRHGYYFIQAWVKSSSDNPEKYFLTSTSLWILSISIAYILTAIIDGVSI